MTRERKKEEENKTSRIIFFVVSLPVLEKEVKKSYFFPNGYDGF